MTAPTVTLEECAVDFEMNCGCGERGCMNCDRCALVRAAAEVVAAADMYVRTSDDGTYGEMKRRLKWVREALDTFDKISQGETP